MTFFSFLASWLSPNVIKNRLHEHHRITWKSVWCICCSAAKRIGLYEMTCPFADASRRVTVCRTSLQIKSLQAQRLLQWWCSKQSWTPSSFFSSFNTLPQSILFFNFFRLILLNVLSVCWKRNLMNLKSTDVFKIKRRWSVPKSWKLVQTFWRRKQMWAFKRSGLTFLDHPAQYTFSFFGMLVTFLFYNIHVSLIAAVIASSTYYVL